MPDESDRPSSLYARISRLRWQAAGLALVLVLVHQWIEHAYLFFLPRWTHFWTQVVFYGLVGPILAWLALSSLREQVAETEQAERRLRRSRDKLADVNQRLEFLISVERRLAEARAEDELHQLIMELPNEVLPTLGSSLVLFDPSGQPLAPIHAGSLPPDEYAAWTAHLATRQAAKACSTCRAATADPASPCPILTAAPEKLEAKRVYCLRLTRGGRQYAALNLYLSDPAYPSVEEEALLEVMGSAMSMALEAQILRSKEIEALAHLQELHTRESLGSQLELMLANASTALDIHGGAILLASEERNTVTLHALSGERGPLTDEILTGFAASVRESEGALIAGHLGLVDPIDFEEISLVASPLRRDGKWLGALLVWTLAEAVLSQHQLRLVEVIGSQASLLIENHRLYQEVEYRAGSAERARLAREIHDGLAQTLGYLKLRAGQMNRWLEDGREKEVAEGISEIRRLLDEAYIDAREAIDGLRIDTSRGEMQDWLDQTYHEFRSLSGMQVSTSTVPPVELRPEMQAQILRIVQEALGNVRKHSHASHALVDWVVDREWLVVTIEDDGIGFDPSDVPPISRHGLRIMRERAELLGADFQIRSRKGEGTQISVRLPLRELKLDSSYD